MVFLIQHAEEILFMGRLRSGRITLPVKLGVVGWLYFSVCAAWDAGRDALRLEGLAIPVTVVTAVSQQFFGRR